MISNEDLEFARKCIERALRNNGQHVSADSVRALQIGEISVVADIHGGGPTTSHNIYRD